MVFDKAKFRVQADVLVQVPRRIVWLGPEHGSDLKNALKNANHDLLIKLRALSQVGRSVKVVQFEHVRPALGGRCDDLGSLDLGKATGRERAAKTSHCPAGEAQNGPPRRVAVGDNGMIEQCTEASRDLALLERNRRP